MNTVHTLSQILCMVLRWARSCTEYVTLGGRLGACGVTVKVTYIHLAIGRDERRGAGEGLGHVVSGPVRDAKHAHSQFREFGFHRTDTSSTWLMISQKHYEAVHGRV